MLREIAPTVIFDDVGGLLLQQRDDIPVSYILALLAYSAVIGRAKRLFWLARCEKFTRSLAFMCRRNGSIFSRGLKAPIPKIPKELFAQSSSLSAGLWSLTLQSRKASCWWLRRPSSTQSAKN